MANVTAENLETLLLTDLQAAVTRSSVSCTTAGTTTLTSAALFGPVSVGMKIFGTGIQDETYVTAIASTSSLTMSAAATDSTTTTRIFAFDPPLSLGPTGETYRLMNDAYAIIWDIHGGAVKTATSATLWTPDQSSGTTGIATGDIATIGEILHLWSSTSATSVGGEAGDYELHRVDYSEILMLRSHGTGLGTYTTPQVFSLTLIDTTTAADVGKLRLDYWPGITALYFPAHYIPLFTNLAATSDVPVVSDLFQRDIAHLAAWNAAPLIGRPEFQDTIMKKITEKTRVGLERRAQAMVDARQDA